MARRTAEEALADDVRVLGSEYGLAFYHCCQEFWRISSSWDRYEALFGSQERQERVDLLNESSGIFWHAIQNLLLEQVLLSVSRLCDTARTGRQRNLSIWTLVELDPSKHKVRLKQCAIRATKRAVFAKTWRDKRIAHNDFEQSTGLFNKIDPATRRKITRLILAIHDVFRWIRAKHFDGDMWLVEIGDYDAIKMMTCIDDGLRFRALREADYDSGNTISRYESRYAWIQTGAGPMKRYPSDSGLKLPGTARFRSSA